jgi:ElaB/YqjD/DUF883 family membrane-anchored ribosome-binding protein
MGEDPDRIRRDIEATRDQMSETVDAIGYKADVPARAKDSLQEKRDSAKETIMGATDSIRSSITGATSRVSDATPSTGQVKQTAKRGAGLAQENPLGLAIGSVAVGFVAGLLLPSTRVEDERLGELSDEVIDRAKETGQEALERGKSVAQEAAQSAKETAQESGQQHAEELKLTAQEKAQETKPGIAAGHD